MARVDGKASTTMPQNMDMDETSHSHTKCYIDIGICIAQLFTMCCNRVSQLSIYVCCESVILRIFAFWCQQLADSQK